MTLDITALVDRAALMDEILTEAIPERLDDFFSAIRNPNDFL
jgi:hypothetical protein